MRVRVTRTRIEELDLEMVPFDGEMELEAAIARAQDTPPAMWLTADLSYSAEALDD